MALFIKRMDFIRLIKLVSIRQFLQSAILTQISQF